MQKSTAVLLTSLILFFSITLAVSQSPQGAIDLLASHFVTAETPQHLSELAKPLHDFQENYKQSLHNALADQHLVHKMRQELQQHLEPHTLVPLFFQHMDRLPHAERSQKLHDLQMQVRSNHVSQTPGGISGRVTVDGEPAPEGVTVFAFDNHGSFAGSSEVNAETGEYTITELKSDSFYVVTRSDEFVDEIYNDVASPLGSWDTWRQAEKVFVSLAIVGGIDFELNRGVPISGTVLAPDGSPVEDGTFVDFSITSAEDSSVLATRSVELSDGMYDMLLPATGQFKIKAEVSGYEPVWYPDQSSWQSSQVVDIPDLNASPTLDFQLQTETSGPTGEISGTVSPALFALAAAYSVEDTSFVQMGASLGFLAVPYLISELPPGDYFVYADDYLSTLLGGENYRGEFYDGSDGAYVASQAQTVTVVSGEETTDINFTLDEGATIQGKVTDSSGTPLDSVTLVLLNSDVLESGPTSFLERFELHVVSTDFNGEYTISGLPPNEYLLRTLSDFFINFDLANTDSILLDGKHKGNVIDQFSGGEPNLFRVSRADRVVLATEGQVQEINFTLPPANSITGTLTMAADNAPLTDVTMVALEDSSGFPFFPFGEIDSLGHYELGPLPQGTYKVIALTGLDDDPGLLSEYYNDQKSFFTAEVVDLSDSLVENIDFALEQGATIEGYVQLSDDGGYRAGADTLDGMPVVAFDAETGYVASYDFVQFNGGFRIDRLLPGTYKLMTVPTPSEYATTYLGGGMAYEEAQTDISVNLGEVSGDHVITLQTAAGRLTGTVTDNATGSPLSGVFVGAYDATGHLVAYDLTDYDARTGKQIGDTGTYEIRGLRDGTYYVRTVAIFMALSLVDEATSFIGMFDSFDFLSLLSGDLFSGLSLDVPIYKDHWYPAEPAGISIRLDELVYQASAYGLPSENDYALLPIYLPLPFQEPIPPAAQTVEVTSDGAMTVDFALGSGVLDDLLSEVETDTKEPQEFVLHPNYPNPFNPSTTLSFSLPAAQTVDIDIYDTRGRRVRTLSRARYAAGTHSLTWNGRDDFGMPAAAGVYLLRVQAGEYQHTRKMVLVK